MTTPEDITGDPYILKSNVDAQLADLQKEIDQNLELWDADIADHNKTIAALADALDKIEDVLPDDLMSVDDIVWKALSDNAPRIAEAQAGENE